MKNNSPQNTTFSIQDYTSCMKTEKFIEDVRTLGEVFTFTDMIDLYQDDYDMYGMAPCIFQMFIRDGWIVAVYEKNGEVYYKLIS